MPAKATAKPSRKLSSRNEGESSTNEKKRIIKNEWDEETWDFIVNYCRLNTLPLTVFVRMSVKNTIAEMKRNPSYSLMLNNKA